MDLRVFTIREAQIQVRNLLDLSWNVNLAKDSSHCILSCVYIDTMTESDTFLTDEVELDETIAFILDRIDEAQFDED